MVKKKIPDFKGKCLSLSIMDDSCNHDLWSPYFDYQGGRLFILGTIPAGASEADWSAGCKGAVAWDQVTEYVVFDSVEAYTEAINKSKKNQKKKKRKNKKGDKK
jgi:hypothetical protein